MLMRQNYFFATVIQFKLHSKIEITYLHKFDKNVYTNKKQNNVLAMDRHSTKFYMNKKENNA